MKIPVGILGATGMVGQRFIEILDNHPWFEINILAASPRSAGLKYEEAIKEKNTLKKNISEKILNLTVLEVESDAEKICEQVSFVFSALDLDKEKIKEIKNNYASLEIPVVSNNPAHRWTPDIPMFIPEVNEEHTDLIPLQQKNRGWKKGFIVVKPNCSIQSYVPLLHALKDFEPEKAIVTTFQAISGAGKTFETWPEMIDNVIPYIQGEEEKSEKEPLKVWGKIKNAEIIPSSLPQISANCIRVPVSDGHLVSVNVLFKKKASQEEIINAWKNFNNPILKYNLPLSPKPCINYFVEDNRPQTKLDRNLQNGMGISVGRLRKDNIFDWKFVSLSHNTIRGAAGGAVLTAELLKAKGYLN